MSTAQEDLLEYKEAFLSWIKSSGANHLKVIRDCIEGNMDTRFSLNIQRKEISKQEVHDVRIELLMAVTEKEIQYAV